MMVTNRVTTWNPYMEAAVDRDWCVPILFGSHISTKAWYSKIKQDIFISISELLSALTDLLKLASDNFV